MGHKCFDRISREASSTHSCGHIFLTVSKAHNDGGEQKRSNFTAIHQIVLLFALTVRNEVCLLTWARLQVKALLIRLGPTLTSQVQWSVLSVPLLPPSCCSALPLSVLSVPSHRCCDDVPSKSMRMDSNKSDEVLLHFSYSERYRECRMQFHREHIDLYY